MHWIKQYFHFYKNESEDDLPGEGQAGKVSEVCSLSFNVDLGQNDLAE